MGQTAPSNILVTSDAPVNIALIKYWGKRDAELNLPLHDSISITLDPRVMRSRTTISASLTHAQTRMKVNDQDVPVSDKFRKILQVMLPISENLEVDGKVLVGKQEWPEYKLSINSSNNFPTAAGLASSASGYCALVSALACLYQVKVSTKILSAIARLGSGSASRSFEGGFVRWNAGEREDGADCFAEQVHSEDWWPELRALVMVVSSQRKNIGSTDAMLLSQTTSGLWPARQARIQERLATVSEAIEEKNFAKLGEAMMRESDEFHSICTSSFPPIQYLTDASKTIIQMVHAINRIGTNKYQCKVAYTFDAGPNAVLFTTQEHLHEIVAAISFVFGSKIEDPNQWLVDPLGILNDVSESQDITGSGSTDVVSVEEKVDESEQAPTSTSAEDYLFVSQDGTSGEPVSATEPSRAEPMAALSKDLEESLSDLQQAGVENIFLTKVGAGAAIVDTRILP